MCSEVSETRGQHRRKKKRPCCIGTVGNSHCSTREAERKTSTKSHSEEFPVLPVQQCFLCLSIYRAHNASHWFVDRSRIASKRIQILQRRFFLHLLLYVLAHKKLLQRKTRLAPCFSHKFHVFCILLLLYVFNCEHATPQNKFFCTQTSVDGCAQAAEAGLSNSPFRVA